MIVAVITFVAMEGVTWLSHRYIMHGVLWQLHRDHHRKEEGSFFERNDAFFLIFSIPAISLFITGAYYGTAFAWPVGAGITAYGFAYFMVHDVWIHRRFRWVPRVDNFYFRALRKAHKMHHKHLDRHHGECFGMLVVPWRYFVEAWRSK